MSDRDPLLSSVGQKRRCPVSYHFQFIRSKGAVLVLLWDFMIGIVQNELVYSAGDTTFNAIGWVGLTISFLLAGHLGDACFSRYKLIIIGSYLTMALLITQFIAFIVESSLPIMVVYGLLLITVASVRVTLLPFNYDQLTASSSDELSAVVHWHNIAPFIVVFFGQLIPDFVPDFTFTAICSVCITVILVSHSFFNRYLDTTPTNTTNPVKLIVRVLCYAWKHKYPENRSALTYWEEEAPSRLDLGKEKYGGPFTEEEVEDVKTAIRLLPIIAVCIIPDSLMNEFIIGVTYYGEYGCDESFIAEIGFSILGFIFLLLHQFLIHPCFYKYIPSMLKRIGLALVLVSVINIAFTIMTLIGKTTGHLHCLVALDELVSLPTGAVTWNLIFVIPKVLIWYAFEVTIFEFILAQTPNFMKGTFIGLWYSCRILRVPINFVLFLPFLHYIHSGESLGRGFYFFLTRAVLSISCLLLFIFIAKRYRFRVREVEINIHQIAESHTIRNIQQEYEYETRRREVDSSISTLHIISGFQSSS